VRSPWQKEEGTGTTRMGNAEEFAESGDSVRRVAVWEKSVEKAEKGKWEDGGCISESLE